MPIYDIENRRSRQKVDLQPYGNTISVEAKSDNPFEDAQDVEVFTQVSGGMAGADPRQRSRRIITKPARERIIFAGRAKAVKTSAPAHVQHAAFIPGLSGLGADPAPVSPGIDWNAVIKSTGEAATAAGGIIGQKFQSQTAASQASQAAAEARAEQARTERATAMTMLNNMGQHKGISGTFLAIAGVAAVAGLFLFMKGKKKK